MALQAVLLDRDGVLNQNRPGHVTRPEHWRWLPGAIDACRRLAALGLRLAVVTNQAVIGRGLLTEAGLSDLHARMRADLASAGVPPPAVHHCPHRPEDGCDCRKPRPGLLLRALHDLSVEPARALLVGDHDTDLAAAAAAGCWSLHVRSGRGVPTPPRPGHLGSVTDLSAAVDVVTALGGSGWFGATLPADGTGRLPRIVEEEVPL